jgi:hypothetical protein
MWQESRHGGAGGPGYHYRLNSRGWPVQAPLGRGFSADGRSRTVGRIPARAVFRGALEVNSHRASGLKGHFEKKSTTL